MKQNTNKNHVNWVDESKPIIESNGMLYTNEVKYKLNIKAHISDKDFMTKLELECLIDRMRCIVSAYNACKEYIR